MTATERPWSLRNFMTSNHRAPACTWRTLVRFHPSAMRLNGNMSTTMLLGQIVWSPALVRRAPAMEIFKWFKKIFQQGCQELRFSGIFVVRNFPGFGNGRFVEVKPRVICFAARDSDNFDCGHIAARMRAATWMHNE